MEKISLICLALVLACVLNVKGSGQSLSEQLPTNSLPDAKAAFVGSSAQGCSQPEKLIIPEAVATRAKLKARLVNLLRESLYDDAKGIVNVAREKEIKELAHKLTKGEAQ